MAALKDCGAVLCYGMGWRAAEDLSNNGFGRWSIQQHMRQTSIPLLHIADAAVEKIKNDGSTTVGLLGTRFTMEDEFYKGRLVDRHSLTVIIPDDAQRGIVHQVIYDELCLGVIQPTARQKYAEIMNDLVNQGAEAIILGCTEIGLLVHSADCRVPVFDTMRIHAKAAVNLALAGE